MLPSYGLYTHIRANHVRSVVLIGVLLALVGVLTFAVALAMTGLTRGVRPEQLVDVALLRTWSMLPYATLGAVAWVGIGFAFNREIASRLAGAERVTRSSHPRLYNLLENLCISRGITMPRLEIIHTPVLNAFASGMNDEQYTVTVTEGLLERLTDDEVEVVLAHELTHIRNRDVTIMVLAVIIVGMIATIGEFTLRTFARGLWFRPTTSRRKGGAANAFFALLAALALIAMAWLVSQMAYFALSRRREYLADAGAVELTKNPDAMIRALRKISGDSDLKDLPGGMMHMCIDNPRKGFTSLFATHPSIANRIEALVAYADGREDLTRRPSVRPLGNEAKEPRQRETDAAPSRQAPASWGPWGVDGVAEAVVVASSLDTQARSTSRASAQLGFGAASEPPPGRATFGRRRAGIVRKAPAPVGSRTSVTAADSPAGR